MEMDEIARDFAGRTFHVVGMGKSGISAANLLDALGADVRISDRRGLDALPELSRRIAGGVRVLPGVQGKELIEDVDCLVLSPGVAQEEEIVKEAQERGMEIIGEIELAYRVLERTAAAGGTRIRWYGVTGTNGKSTTVSLLYEMLKQGGRDAVLSGNIGYPLSEEALRRLRNPEDLQGTVHMVLELSSFQLERIRDLHLHMSALLNITEDHLDRYADMEAYAAAKAAIFANQTVLDHAVVNSDDEETVRRASDTAAKVHYVSLRRETGDAFLRSGGLCLDTGEGPRVLLKVPEVRMAGVHNICNALFAALMASLAGVDDEAIVHVLRHFPGLEHRLEFAGEKDGVRFFNDSKGTNVGAVIRSLESFESNVILIAGGRDKNGDFDALVPYVEGRVKKVVVIGEASERIARALGGVVTVEHALTLKDAVACAFSGAVSGDVILLSPACASFDMFRNFEERGRRFRDIVNELIRGN